MPGSSSLQEVRAGGAQVGASRSPAQFDTPISQVAREDESYFKVEKREERKERSIDQTKPPLSSD
jgi:hypothetical protein